MHELTKDDSQNCMHFKVITKLPNKIVNDNLQKAGNMNTTTKTLQWLHSLLYMLYCDVLLLYIK